MQTYLVQAVRHIVQVTDQTGPLFPEPDHRVLKDGSAANGVWIDPVPENFIVGKLRLWASVASVSPIRLPGYWYFKNGSTITPSDPPSPRDKIILSLHGGSYTSGTAHPSGMNANIVNTLLEHVDKVTRVFALEYRLSTTTPLEPANPFPTALIDALSGYYYLVQTCGFSPSDIVIEGDSSGGNLAHALTRYLVEYSDTLLSIDRPLAPPGSLLLLSPWCDIGLSHDVPRSNAILVSDYDPEPQGMDYAKAAFVGPHGMGAADRNEYISPSSRHPCLSVSFKGFPKTLIVAGGAENLLPQIQLFRDRMIRDLGKGNATGGKVMYYEGKDAPHDHLLFFWQEPTRPDALKAILHWFNAE